MNNGAFQTEAAIRMADLTFAALTRPRRYTAHRPVTNAQSAVVCLQHIVTRFQQEPDVVFIAGMAIGDVAIEASLNGEIVNPLKGSGDHLPAAPAILEALTDADFEHYESGKLRAGIKWFSTCDGPKCPGECYQFSTLGELLDHARSFQNDPDIVSFSLLTHSGQYKNMRTVYEWTRETA